MPFFQGSSITAVDRISSIPKPSIRYDDNFDAVDKSHKGFMKTHRAIINSVFPPQKLQLLEDFLHKPKHSLLNSQEQRGLPNFRVYDMKSLLGYSFVTSDVLEKYQQKLATTCSNVLFVQPTLYRILEESRSPLTYLCEKEFHKYEFVFWPINIGGTQKKGSEHWVAGVHSTNDKSKLFYLDTWGSIEAQRSRMPQGLLQTVNSYLQQQIPPISRRLCESSRLFFPMTPFEDSHILRIKQAKMIFDFVLQMQSVQFKHFILKTAI